MELEEKNIIKGSFSNIDTGNYVKLPTTFTYETAILSEYGYCKNYIDYNTYLGISIPNATVITATLPISYENDKSYMGYKRCRIDASDTYYLSSLINLRLQLSQEIFNEFADIEHLLLIDNISPKKNLNKIMFKRPYVIEPIEISDNDLNLIKQWCEKNGYPFSMRNKINGKNIKSKIISQNQDVIVKFRNSLIYPKNNITFWVWEFLRKLQILYAAFILFYKITDSLNLKDIDVTDTLFENYDNTQCTKLLQKIYSSVNLIGLLDFQQYQRDNKNMLMGYGTANVFDLSIYSLFVFMSMSNKTLKRCKICQRLFEPKNTRQKYCNTKPCEVDRCKDDRRPDCFDYCTYKTCYPQLFHKRKTSQEKKNNTNT